MFVNFVPLFKFCTCKISECHHKQNITMKVKVKGNENYNLLIYICMHWRIEGGPWATNNMRVSRSRKPLQHFYSLGNEILQEVSDAKYLGVTLDKQCCSYMLMIN